MSTQIPVQVKPDEYDALALDYSKYKTISEVDWHGYRAVLAALGDPKGKLILDIGCGQGNFSRVIADKGGKVVGVDLSQKMIEQAKRADSTVHYEVISRAQFPFSDNKFDAAISTFCLCTEPDFSQVEKTLAETARVLKAGAKMVIMHANYVEANGQSFGTHAIEHVPNLRHTDAIKVYLHTPDGPPFAVQDYYHDMQHYTEGMKRQGLGNISIKDISISDGRKPYKLIVAQKVA